MTSQEDYIKSSVRMPQELHAELVKAAAENGRSLNAEMLSRLSSTTVNSKLDSIQKLVLKVLDAVNER